MSCPQVDGLSTEKCVRQVLHAGLGYGMLYHDLSLRGCPGLSFTMGLAL